jgi:hypothetical protein
MGRIGDGGAFRCLATEQRHAEAIFLAFKWTEMVSSSVFRVGSPWPYTWYTFRS